VSAVLGTVTSPVSDLPGLICIDIAIIIVVARLVGALFRRIGQPAVIGEIITGILLGPSVLGAFPGDPTARLFPPGAVPSLNVLAQLGVVLFMFIVGLEVDLGLVRGRRRTAGTVSIVSVAMPFALGIALATYLYSTYSPAGRHVSQAGFVLFIGASLSVTAFPVLARILAERKMMTTDLGAFTLACAAVDDVMAWTLLAVVVAVVSSKTPLQVPLMMLELAGFIAVAFLGVRPLLRWLIQRNSGQGTISPTLLAVVLVGLLVSAWITDKIGIDLIFGAFIFGAAVPKDAGQHVVAGMVERMESVTLLLLLPIFFVVAGLGVNIRTIGVEGLEDLLLILVVAVGGKFFGAAMSARAQGITSRRSFAIGTLMNTRGLTELIILTVGVKLGVLDRKLFTLLVIMAVVTTLGTGPLFKWFYPERMLQADIDESQRRLRGDVDYQVMAVLGPSPDSVSDSVSGSASGSASDDPALFACAADLAGRGGEVVVVRFLSRLEGPGPYSGVSGELVRMASAMDELNALAATRADVRVRPLAQFSSDAGKDLVALARRSGVDATLFRHSDPILGSGGPDLAQLAECDVMSFRPGTLPDGGAVQVVVGRGGDAEAALEAGVRIAISRASGATTSAVGRPSPGPSALLELVPATPSEIGRCRRISERLMALALARAEVLGPVELERMATPDSDGAVPLQVVGWHHGPSAPRDGSSSVGTARGPGPVLVTHGHDDPQRVGLDERLARLGWMTASERSGILVGREEVTADE
jgi:Kef-type K+ transport system membrane component KefB